MPPKKKTAAATPPAVDATAQRYADACRPFLIELARLIESHAQRHAHHPTSEYAATVEAVTEEVRQLEKPLAHLAAVQKEEQQRRKAAQPAVTPAAGAASSAPAAAASSTAASASPSTTVVAPLSSSPSHSPSPSQLSSLASWLQSRAPGCLVGSAWEFDPGVGEEGTGVRAARELGEGERFMSVPRAAMMTTDGLAKSSPIGQLLATDPLCSRNASLLLTVCLMYERAMGDASKWAPYIACLPRHVNLPVLWSVDQVRHLLQASPIVLDVLSLQHSLVRQYLHVHALLAQNASKVPKSFLFDWHGFQWAISIIMSRQNRVPTLHPSPSSPADTIALIPGWDSCNHRGHGRVATFYEASTHEMQAHTMEPVAKGAPIYLYYGARSNAQLMTFAGFVDAQHRNDKMDFILTLDSRAAMPPAGVEASASGSSSSSSAPAVEDPLVKLKLLLLKKAGQSATFATKLPFHVEGAASSSGGEAGQTVSGEEAQAEAARAQEARQQSRALWHATMHFARVACLSTKDQVGLALKHKPSFGNPLSPSFHFLPALYPEHDLHAYTFLHDALAAAAHAYGTTLEHDEAELLRDEARREAGEHDLQQQVQAPVHAPGEKAQQRLGRQHRLALELRRVEKKMLRQAAERMLALKEAEHAKLAAADGQ